MCAILLMCLAFHNYFSIRNCALGRPLSFLQPTIYSLAAKVGAYAIAQGVQEVHLKNCQSAGHLFQNKGCFHHNANDRFGLNHLIKHFNLRKRAS